MKRHSTDLLALLFGAAFTIAGVIVLVTQATSVDVSPQWAAAVSLIALGAMALAVTVARAQDERARAGAGPRVSDERSAG